MSLLDEHTPGRHLVGFEHRLKDRGRIEEKIIHDMAKRGVSADRAFDALTDALRYTFQYPDGTYADGVRADVERLKAEGFAFTGVRNMWASAEFKGITSVWRTPESSGRAQLFEVQFHTTASFAARQDTFAGYSRLRTLPADPAVVRELRAEQRLAAARVPVPPGALELMTGVDAHGRGAPAPPRDARPTTYYAIVDSYGTPGEPSGVLRRTGGDDGDCDEEFGSDLEWTRSWVRYSWERGNLDAELSEVSEAGAGQIIERIRHAAARSPEPAEFSQDH